MNRMISSDLNPAEIRKEEEPITYVCFIGPNRQDILAPLWYYGSAIKHLYLLYNTDFHNVASYVYSEIMNQPEFANTIITRIHYSRKETNIDSFKSFIRKKVHVPDDGSDLVISVSGCSKPVFLSVILFAYGKKASIILSASYSSFEIFEDGLVRIQEIQNTLKWYLGHNKLRIYPKISPGKMKNSIIPEASLKNRPELIQDYQMSSTITSKNWVVDVDFACTTKNLLILGKVFTEDGDSFVNPCRIFRETEKNFGENCRIMIYTVGDRLFRLLQERLDSCSRISIIHLPDPWCLTDYPEFFDSDLSSLISKKIP